MKNNWVRWIAVLLTLVMLLAALPTPVFALPDDGESLPDEDVGEELILPDDDVDARQSSLAALTYDAGVEGASVCLSQVGGEYYLFLPAFADLSEIVLHFAGEPVMLTAGGESITVTSGEIFDLNSLYDEAPDNGVYAVTFSRGDESLAVKVMVSAHIGSMFITSTDPVNKGRDYVELVKGNKATGQMTLLGTGGETVYMGNLTQIKGRGNSTWSYPKKPYQIKLGKKTDLLETGDPGEAAKTWVLLANYYDDAFIRNSLTFDLAAELGLPYSPGSRPVDLYYDGAYRGTYLLCEKTEIGRARVDIHDLEADFEDANPDVDDFDDLPTAEGSNAYGNEYHYVAGMTDPADISGGYLLELDYAERAAEEKSWFTTSQGFNIVSKSPEYLSMEAMEYISGFYQEFEDAVWNGGVNPTTGKSYTDYVDLESLARCYVIAELSQDGDAYRSSTFFYKPSGEEKLYAGPVWDFDSVYGRYIAIINDKYLVANMTSLGQKLLTIPSFCEAIEDIYGNELHPLVTDVLLSTDAGTQTGRVHSLAGYQAEVSVSQQMNSVLWPESSPKGYAAAVNALRDFITRRSEYLVGLDWTSLWDSPGALMFPDIFADGWYVSYITYAVDKGLFAGNSEGRFEPETVMTRAMAVTVLHRLAGTPEAADGPAFDDVSPEQWYAEAVAWAAQAGVVEGYPDGCFRPDNGISRQEMAVFFYRYYTQCAGGDGTSPALPDRFLDRDDVADWAADAMAWAVDQGVLNGVSDKELAPNGYTQRCMAAAMLQRYCGVVEAELDVD